MSGSDFRLSYKDLNDPVKVAEEISKNSPDGLKTSRSADPRGDPTDHTLMSTSDILLRSPAMKSEQEIQSLIHQRVFGGMSAIKDEIGSIPGIGDLLPDGMIDEFGIDPSSGGGDINAIPLDGDYPPGAQQYIRNLISLAKAEIGYLESPPGSNKNKFAGPAGVANGYAWCATMIMALCKEAGMPQGKLLTPGTETSYDNYKKAGRLNKDPKVGAFAFFNYKSGRRVSHVAITIGIEGDRIITIDGNTTASDKGSQDNGGMVAEKVRPLSKVVAFCHPVFPEGALNTPSSASGASTELSAGNWTRPIGGKVNSGYGWRIDPISGKRDHHYGIDYHGKTGDPIYAARAGRVVHSANFVGEVAKGINGDYGLMVEIDHGGGYRTRYGHMSAFAVSAGVSVEAGQRIGSVGNTGRSTAPHLHFEVRKDGQPINPAEVGI